MILTYPLCSYQTDVRWNLQKITKPFLAFFFEQKKWCLVNTSFVVKNGLVTHFASLTGYLYYEHVKIISKWSQFLQPLSNHTANSNISDHNSTRPFSNKFCTLHLPSVALLWSVVEDSGGDLHCLGSGNNCYQFWMCYD